jgi:hypothetical protein
MLVELAVVGARYKPITFRMMSIENEKTLFYRERVLKRMNECGYVCVCLKE